MLDDPVLLARIQFAANISFHILFPAVYVYRVFHGKATALSYD